MKKKLKADMMGNWKDTILFVLKKVFPFILLYCAILFIVAEIGMKTT